MKLLFGFSPCPNDTFMFHALAKGLLTLPGYKIEPRLHDVETLNQMAFDQVLDISKMSFYAWLQVKENYHLLNSGGALGYGCGPVVIARPDKKNLDLSQAKIILPGRWTTAHLLFQLWAPNASNRQFVPYEQIFNFLENGQADMGVIIHESRFTFAQAGFIEITDLGKWWEEQTSLPIPLGCIAVKKNLPKEKITALENLIQQSIRMARKNPKTCLPYIRQYAQEFEKSVLTRHINTFVNDFSENMGKIGQDAVVKLEELSRQVGVQKK